MIPDGSRGPGDTDRRYTDQEVALVLQRAAEIEEQRAVGSATRGLSLRELHDIAREVGLSPDVIDQAVSAIGTGTRRPRPALLGAPLATKVARGVPGHLDQDKLRALIRLVEDRFDATGTITEALGTVRWTSVSRGHRFDASTQVSFSRTDDETQIHVIERFPARLRAVLHLLPTMWGAMIGGAVAASTASGALTGIGIGLGIAALGLGIGRTIWQTLARRGRRRVEAIAAEVADEAKRLASQ